MKEAFITDRPLIIDLLCASFAENLSVNYITRVDGDRAEAIRGLMEYSYNICAQFGKIYVSEDRKACALVLFPEQKILTLKSLFWDIKLILNVIGLSKLRQTLKREAAIKRTQPDKVRMYYLWFLGVDPIYQQRGIGTRLFKDLEQDAYFKGRTIYLETSTVSNLSWYKRLGMEIYGQIDLDYHLYFFKQISVG